jgi:hypothetical protein
VMNVEITDLTTGDAPLERGYTAVLAEAGA